MDCCLDEVGVEQLRLSKMDCCLDEVLALEHLLQVHFHPRLVELAQVLTRLLLLPREML
jgi:hypothetical protein